MNDAHKERFFAGLVGYVYPTVEPMGQEERRSLRRWVIRSARPLPEDSRIAAASERITRIAEGAVRAAYEEHTSQAALQESMPVIRLVRIDDARCVAEIEVPTAAHAVGDAVGIGTWTTLRAIDEAFGIEDLQGLPKKLWFQLK
jgi:hypothetical protein